jgi:hypothetical protein
MSNLPDNHKLYCSASALKIPVNTLFTEMPTFPCQFFVYNITNNQRIQDHPALTPSKTQLVCKTQAPAYIAQSL